MAALDQSGGQVRNRESPGQVGIVGRYTYHGESLNKVLSLRTVLCTTCSDTMDASVLMQCNKNRETD